MLKNKKIMTWLLPHTSTGGSLPPPSPPSPGPSCPLALCPGGWRTAPQTKVSTGIQTFKLNSTDTLSFHCKERPTTVQFISSLIYITNTNTYKFRSNLHIRIKFLQNADSSSSSVPNRRENLAYFFEPQVLDIFVSNFHRNLNELIFFSQNGEVDVQKY